MNNCMPAVRGMDHMDGSERKRAPRHGLREIVSALLVVSAALASAAWAQEDRPEDFLPLAVGNRWVYQHRYFDLQGLMPAPEGAVLDTGIILAEATIEITHTETIDGHAYFVFSELDYTWPPAPHHFLAGKKVRFAADGRLLEALDGGEVWLYDFSRGYDGVEEYDVPEQATDVRVDVWRLRSDVGFNLWGDWSPCCYGFRDARFRLGFGMTGVHEEIRHTDAGVYANLLGAEYAIIDNRRVKPGYGLDVVTAVSPGSWGVVKATSRRR